MKDPLPFVTNIYSKADCDSRTVAAQQAICVLLGAFSNLPNAVDPHTGRFLPQPCSQLANEIFNSWQNKMDLSCDRISKMITYLERPLKAILDSPRDKIIRTHCMQKQQQAKSVDSKTLKWLTHQPGASTYEKCALAKNILAVKREFNLDTSENRLLKAFLNHFLPLLQLRQESISTSILPEETSLYRLIKTWLREQGQVIRAWNNLPPNNVLLQDKNYRKIWNSWEELQVLSDTLESDGNSSRVLSLQVFFFLLIARLQNKGVDFAEIPVLVNLRSGVFSSGFDISVPGKHVRGISRNKNKTVALSLSLNDCQIIICTSKKQLVISIDDNENLCIDGEYYPCTGLEFSHVLSQILKYLGQNGGFIPCPAEKSLPCVEQSPCVDFYHNFPIWSGNDCITQPEHNVFLARQYWADTSTSLPLTCAPAWLYDNELCNTDLLTDMWNDKFACYDPSRFAMDIATDIRNYFQSAQTPTFILPDMLSDLDERAKYFKAALEQVFIGKGCSWLPASIATVFSLMQLGKLTPKERMTICIAEQYGDILSLTAVTAKRTSFSEDLKSLLPETDGFVWERYPSYKFNIQNAMPEERAMTILSEKYTNKPFFEKKDKWHIPGLTTQKITIAEEWIAKTCKTSDVALVIISPGIDAKRNFASMVSADEQTRYLASGAAYLGVLEGKCHRKYHLWSDVLPNLSIMTALDGRRQYTSLISDNHEPIYAEKGREVPLSTGKNLKFEIPKGKQKQECRLYMETGNEKLEYSVELQLPSTPSNDIECSLSLKYTYGAADPYTLEFIPCNPKTAGFPLLTGHLTRVDNTHIDDERAYAAPLLPPLQEWPQNLDEDDQKLMKRLLRFNESWWNSLEHFSSDVKEILKQQQQLKVNYIHATKIELDKWRITNGNYFFNDGEEISIPADLLVKYKIDENTTEIHILYQVFDTWNGYQKIKIKHISHAPNDFERTPFIFALNEKNEAVLCHFSSFINRDFKDRFSTPLWHAVVEKQSKKTNYGIVEVQDAIVIQKEHLSESSINLIIENKKREIRNTLKFLIREGRRPLTKLIPNEIQFFLNKITGVLWLKLKQDSSPIMQEIIMEFFASLGDFRPLQYGSWLLERFKAGKYCPGYVLGISLGELEQDWQKELCQLILDSWHDLTISPDLKIATGIAAERSDKILLLMNVKCATNIIKSISNDLQKQVIDFEMNYRAKSDVHACSNTLQFLISMLRLRTVKNEEIRKLLHPNASISKQLQQSLLKLMEMKLDITRRIHGKEKPLPDELYNYLTGENTSDYIEIIEEKADTSD